MPADCCVGFSTKTAWLVLGRNTTRLGLGKRHGSLPFYTVHHPISSFAPVMIIVATRGRWRAINTSRSNLLLSGEDWPAKLDIPLSLKTTCMLLTHACINLLVKGSPTYIY